MDSERLTPDELRAVVTAFEIARDQGWPYCADIPPAAILAAVNPARARLGRPIWTEDDL